MLFSPSPSGDILDVQDFHGIATPPNPPGLSKVSEVNPGATQLQHSATIAGLNRGAVPGIRVSSRRSPKQPSSYLLVNRPHSSQAKSDEAESLKGFVNRLGTGSEMDSRRQARMQARSRAAAARGQYPKISADELIPPSRAHLEPTEVVVEEVHTPSSPQPLYHGNPDARSERGSSSSNPVTESEGSAEDIEVPEHGDGGMQDDLVAQDQSAFPLEPPPKI